MAQGTGHHDVGKHRLGPHVVGQRVVVRRLLHGETGPSGGPAFTDVLGVCTSWAEGTCLIVPESGEPVAIAIADIVSGKPVPPRPSTRHRVSEQEAQQRALAMWAEEGPSLGPETHFLIAGVAAARRRLRPHLPQVEVTLEEDGDRVTARIDERARGMAAFDRDWVGLRGLEVAPEHRRQRLALALLAALLEWGAERGATTACLQVGGDNAPALALVESAGFSTHHVSAT